jgi:hypothetical protein
MKILTGTVLVGLLTVLPATMYGGSLNKAANKALNKVTFMKVEGHGPVSLVKDGKPGASIYINAAELEKQGKDVQARVMRIAAGELQLYIEKSTGARLPIVEEMREEKGAVILVGGDVAKQYGINVEEMEDEAFIVKTFDNRVLIAGRDYDSANPRDPYFPAPSGTLWGVYDFLERFLGIRWYYPGELGTIIPRRDTLEISPVAYRDTPVFKKRVIWRFHGQPPVPRQGQHKYISAQFRSGANSPVPTPCHTPHGWDKVYGKTHPEYFQMNADGKRTPPMWCYSQPAVLEQFIKDVDRFYKSGGEWKEPWGGTATPTNRYIPISPVDMSINCHCPLCRKLINKDSRLGYASQIMGEFLYKLCIEVKKRWPDKEVVFLPYSNYTEPPKGIIFPDNFSVALCWMRTLANLKEPDILKKEIEIADGWRKITSKPLSHWIYTCWPANDTKAPFQFPHVMKNFFNINRGSTGFFCDAGVNWPRTHMTHYLMARLMWNPDFDVDAALNEYYGLMYGRAEKTISRIFTILIDGWEKSRWTPPLPDYHRVGLKTIHEETYPASTVKKIEELIEKALSEVAEDSLERERIEFFKTAMDPFFEESKGFHKGTARKIFDILRVGSMPLIDGRLDEDIWKMAEGFDFVSLNKDNTVPRFPTTAKGVWIPGKGIILGFRMTEPEPEGMRANHSSHDSSVYADDCVEIFLDPLADQGQFYQIVTNSRGALFDAFYYSMEKGWNSKGIVSKGFVGRDFWSVEIFIPFDTLEAGKVKTGDVWLGNFTRTRWSEKDGNEISRFSTSYEPAFVNLNLKTQHFANIRFIE